MARVIGINRTSDASISLLDNGDLVFAVAKERLTREKHHWGKPGDLSKIYLEKLPDLAGPVDLVVECYSSDEEIKNMGQYRQEIERHLAFREGAQVIQIPHHLSHVYSAFFPSPFEEAAVMVFDFQGSHLWSVTEPFKRRGDIEEQWVEVISYYDCRQSEVTCVEKQFWSGNRDEMAGLGVFYSRLTRCMFPGEGNEGTVMGLAPYGNPDAFSLPPLHFEEGHITVPGEWTRLFNDSKEFSFFIDGSGSFAHCANLAAAGQRAFEEALLKCVTWLKAKTGRKNLILVGGCALNCAANGMLLGKHIFENIFVPPATHDGGSSLGCALYGHIKHLGRKNVFKWKNDYLGPRYDVEAFVEQLKNRDDVVVEKPADLAGELAEQISNGQVIAVYQGGSEFGPRALGNRSIIADPRYSFMTHYINSTIKHRQWFRPLSPMVLAEDAGKYFDMDRPSPFMLFATRVKPEYKDSLQAVIHVDGSARVQTVTPQTNPFIYALIEKYRQRVGLSVVMNTSFNGKAEPVVETPADALNCFLSVPLNALVMPPYVIRKTKGGVSAFRK